MAVAGLCCDESACADEPHLPPAHYQPHDPDSASQTVAGQWWDSILSNCEECLNQDYSADRSDCAACGANAARLNPRELASTSATAAHQPHQPWAQSHHQPQEPCCPDWAGIIDECSEACFQLEQSGWPVGDGAAMDDCPDCWPTPAVTAPPANTFARQLTPAATPSNQADSSPDNGAFSDLFKGLDGKTVQEILECCYCAPAATGEDPAWSPSAHFTHSACPSGPHEHTPIGYAAHSASATPAPTAAASLFAMVNQPSPAPLPLAHPSFATLVGQFPAQTVSSPQASFKCEWGICSATFGAKNALARHVNLDHLGLGPPLQSGAFALAPETAHLWNDCSALPKPDPLAQFSLPIAGLQQPHPTTTIAQQQAAVPAPAAPSPILVQQATSTLLKHLIDDHLAKLEPGLAHALGKELQASADAATRLASQHSHSHPKEADLETLSASSTHTYNELEQPSPPSKNDNTRKQHAHHHNHQHAHPRAHSHPHPHAGPHRHVHGRHTHARHHAHPYGVSSSRASSTGPSTGTTTPVAVPDGAHACKWRGCSLRFGTSAELMSHLSLSHVGSGKASYVCEWDGCDRCGDGKGFAQRQKVMRHLQTHTGDRPFVCSTCGKSFSEQMTLTQHRRVHTNERPYKCSHPGCDKAFSLASALTIHQRTHTGDKPFLCPFEGCTSAFAESSNLSKHIRTHKGEKAYGCDECGKAFARSDQLARHRKIHDRDKPAKLAKPEEGKQQSMERVLVEVVK